MTLCGRFHGQDSDTIELCDWSQFLCLYGQGVVEATYDVRGDLGSSWQRQRGVRKSRTMNGCKFGDHDETESVLCAWLCISDLVVVVLCCVVLCYSAIATHTLSTGGRRYESSGTPCWLLSQLWFGV